MRPIGILTAALLVALALALAACSGGDGPDDVEPTVEEVLPTIVATDAASPDGTATPAAIEETLPVATPTIAAESDYAEWLAERDRRVPSHTRPPHNREPTPTPVPMPRPTPDPEPLLRVRVVDVEHCLNVRALPHIEAEIKECIPLGGYVKDGNYEPYYLGGRGDEVE